MVELEAERVHVDDGLCWCNPELVYVSRNGVEVWVHHEPGDDYALSRKWAPVAQPERARRVLN